MHYNENSSRLQAVTVDGRPRFAIRYPKYKKGGHSVSKVMTNPTYGMQTNKYKYHKPSGTVHISNTFILSNTFTMFTNSH